MRRFYDPQPFSQGTPAVLGAGASHHIGKVLRMQPGDPLVLFNGQGGQWQGRITEVRKQGVTVVPEIFEHVDRTPPLAVTLALPMIKGERMDYAIQKATELGVARIQLILCERSEVRLEGERADKKVHHWQQVAISACEQCGMNRVPEVLSPVPLSRWWTECATPLRLIAHPGADQLTPAQLRAHSAVTLLTGPEGGFSPAELDAARQHGFVPFALGERVLRAETAPTALLAAFWAWQAMD